MLLELVTLWESNKLAARTIQHLSMFGIAMAFTIAIGVTAGIVIYKKKKPLA
ncbi:MAG: hypothetical protein ACQEP2_06310 [Actinomycetota bacterium]